MDEKALPATAAVPSEEEVARAIYNSKPRNRPWDILPHEFKNQYRKQARKVAALFAPILAEKERLEAYWIDKHDWAQEEIRQMKESEFSLLSVVLAVLEHRVGDLPTAGYLSDNNASRRALAALAQIAAPGAAMEAQ